MTLRRRILLGCTAIAVVLVLADGFLAATVRSVLLESVDRQLIEAAGRIMRLSTFRVFLGDQPQTLPLPREGAVAIAPRPGSPELVTDLFIAVLDENRALPLGSALGAPSSQMPAIDPAKVARQGQPFTVEAADGSQQWRLVAAPGPESTSILVGMSLKPMIGTLRRVMVIAGLMTAAVLTTLAAVAVWMIRLGVRPMTEMAATAEAIAAGDLGRRVQVEGTGTEASRLGASLNRMLERIAGALAARSTSEERLRRFVADASHELRTPLTSIMGYAELGRAGGLEEAGDRGEAMRRLDEEARRMGVLVDDLLLLAHLDEGRPLELQPVELDRIVADAVADARAIEPDRPIDTNVEPAEVLGDEARLRQVLSNLLANARVHTPPGTPVQVTVQAKPDVVRLEVADEGPGIDAPHRERLFERFYRADPARSRGSGGSGLGLAIVAAVVEAHDGQVSVDERPGGGARFVVELPRAPDSQKTLTIL